MLVMELVIFFTLMLMQTIKDIIARVDLNTQKATLVQGIPYDADPRF